MARRRCRSAEFDESIDVDAVARARPKRRWEGRQTRRRDGHGLFQATGVASECERGAPTRWIVPRKLSPGNVANDVLSSALRREISPNDVGQARRSAAVRDQLAPPALGHC